MGYSILPACFTDQGFVAVNFEYHSFWRNLLSDIDRMPQPRICSVFIKFAVLMNPFVHFLQQYSHLGPAELDQLQQVLTTKKYPAGHTILAAGSICAHISFIVSGKARSYFVDPSGQEFTWNFQFHDADSRFENFFLIDYNSFLTQSPSPLTFTAIEDTEVTQFSFEDLRTLMSQTIHAATLASKMSEAAYQTVHKRAFTLLTLNARARYELLLREEPHLLNKFQHYLIASYIGVAPQSLSRLRKEISQP